MQLIYDVAISLLNIPYLWGGKNPLVGLDCSGLVNVVLHTAGLDTGGNSQALFDYFSKPANHLSQDPQLGALVFYGASETQIDHVGICLNRIRMISAGGGGPTIVSIEKAKERGAYVKASPIYFGPKMRGIFLPEYLEHTTE